MRMWFSICSSFDDAQISAATTLRLKSVTSSRPLVDEEDHHVALGIVFQDAERHVAQQRGLARARRRDDEAAGAFADRAEEVDCTRREAAVLQLHLQKLVGRDRRERGEFRDRAAVLERHAVDRLDEAHLRVRETPVGRERRAADHRALLQLEAADEFLRHEGIRRAALAAFREIDELPVAAALEIDVEDALDADRVLHRGRAPEAGAAAPASAGAELGEGADVVSFGAFCTADAAGLSARADEVFFSIQTGREAGTHIPALDAQNSRRDKNALHFLNP